MPEFDPLGSFINGVMFGLGFDIIFLGSAFAAYLWYKSGREI